MAAKPRNRKVERSEAWVAHLDATNGWATEPFECPPGEEWHPGATITDRTTDYPKVRNEPRVDRFEAASAPATTAKANRFGGACTLCGTWVEANAGLLTKKATGGFGAKHSGACPPAPVVTPRSTPATPPATVAGVYRRHDGRVIRVQVARTSKKPYAVLCGLQGEADAYLGAGRHLEDLVLLTLEEAMAYGKATIRCCVCGIALDNELSRELGIGPICRSKSF